MRNTFPGIRGGCISFTLRIKGLPGGKVQNRQPIKILRIFQQDGSWASYGFVAGAKPGSFVSWELASMGAWWLLTDSAAAAPEALAAAVEVPVRRYAWPPQKRTAVPGA